MPNKVWAEDGRPTPKLPHVFIITGGGAEVSEMSQEPTSHAAERSWNLFLCGLEKKKLSLFWLLQLSPTLYDINIGLFFFLFGRTPHRRRPSKKKTIKSFSPSLRISRILHVQSCCRLR